MDPKRFEFALERLESGDWERFEKLASTFLATEFPDLRTMASPIGDHGRDAELFSPLGDAQVVLQYSVAKDWRAKINKTAGTISKQLYANELIYVTSQVVGAQADNLRRSLRKRYGISLDIRDRNWFIERCNADIQREIAAERLAEELVNPILVSRGILSSKAQALTDVENRAAFVFLGLQLEDDTRDKGLTKLSFEALVRAALRDTNSQARIKRTDVYRLVQAMLPNHAPREVIRRTDSALNHLTKKVIRHWQALDEFCLTHEESVRIRNRLVDVEQLRNSLSTEIKEVIRQNLSTDVGQMLDDVASRVQRVVEKFLLSRGEIFVSTIQTGRYQFSGANDLRGFITRDLSEYPKVESEQAFDSNLLFKIVLDVVTNPGVQLRGHLRYLADAYTLLAFLRETADVQGAVKKMFSHGSIWLDTNMVLPLLAEELVPEDHRKFSAMIRATVEAGLELRVTPGVLEEVERHMNLSLSCARTPRQYWEGSIPFLFSVFIQTGRSPQAFPSWAGKYRGDRRPEDDIADYLREDFSIKVAGLEEEANAVEETLRRAVQEVWQSAHERRRQKSQRNWDTLQSARLANHDVENYLGVIYRRRNERTSSLGYSSWWLTLDRTAFIIERNLKKDHGIEVETPVMSPDFITKYIALGPARMRVSKQTEKVLPTVLELSITETLSTELIDIANDVRNRCKDLPERVIRRNVRDALDEAKAKQGEIVEGGLQNIEDELTRVSKAT